MHEQKKTGSLRVLLIDMISLVISYVIGIYLWAFIYRIFIEEREINNFGYGLVMFIIAFLLVSIFFRNDSDFLRRTKMDEMFQSVKLNFMIMLTVIFIIYILKETDNVSRGVAVVTVFCNVFIDFILRMIFKKTYIRRLGSKKVSQMIVITQSSRVEKLLRRLLSSREWGRRISGLCILDAERQGEKISGIDVVANYYDIIEYAKSVIVDEVLISVSYTSFKHVRDFMSKFEEMGIKVYLSIEMNDEEDIARFDTVQGIPVISYAIRTFSWNQMVVKRIMDILGAIVGCIITIIITPFVAVPLLIESPGPLFFRQKRVGKNGRYFYIYKFRSMYKDAEARKAALMEQNEMKGAMFKMKDDPRITKVGKFIRKTSIDELPQFFNILKGDMSLVGTRPPTVDEFKEYTPYHKRRLSLKPGLTGMWQVSGRSDIEDFEEVVRLDLEYIDNWKVSLDIKIILKTILVVFKHEGSR